MHRYDVKNPAAGSDMRDGACISEVPWSASFDKCQALMRCRRSPWRHTMKTDAGQEEELGVD